MKKTMILLAFLTLLVRPVPAQNRFVLLIKRIALLQVYLEYLQKGYAIARDGWQTVRHITKGEFDLHADYFRSLEKVNPAIKRYGAVAAVLTSEARMIKAIASLRKKIADTEQLRADEVQYLYAVLDGLSSQIEKDLELFALVTKDGQVKMTDADRMEWIGHIAAQVREREQFTATVTATVEGLCHERNVEMNDVKAMQWIYSPSTKRP